MTTSMKSLQTAVTATKLLLRKNLQPALSTPQRLHHSSCLTSSNVPQKHTPLVSIFALQKRTIMKDSWAAESIEANGEKLESIDHKEGLLIDTEYVEGPPPAEVLRLCNEILKLNLVDVHILMNSVQSRMGITDDMVFSKLSGGGGDGGGGVNAVEAVVAEPVKEKEAFDIKLTVVDPKSKIKIIKEVRALTGLGLKEAKDLVEKAPVVIKEGVKKEDLDAIKKILTDAGAQIEIL